MFIPSIIGCLSQVLSDVYSDCWMFMPSVGAQTGVNICEKCLLFSIVVNDMKYVYTK